MPTLVGAVAELRRYPVESMLGEMRPSLTIEERGVVGDRLSAVRDGDGKFGSRKSTRRFRRMDGLADFRARYREDGSLAVTPPCGSELDGSDNRMEQALHRHLGRDDVTLARETTISHFDDSPLHLVTTASMEWLRREVPAVVVDARRVRIGGSVRIEITHRCERCVMVTDAQEELQYHSELLKVLAAGNDLCVGVHVRVLNAGEIAIGDPLVLD